MRSPTTHELTCIVRPCLGRDALRPRLCPLGQLRPHSDRMRARMFWVIGVCLWSAATVARQAAPPAALPVELRTHVQNARFDVVSSVRGLPLGVRAELATLFGGQTLDMAEPGAASQASSEIADPARPIRRLVAAGCSYEDCLVYYERGGSAV